MEDLILKALAEFGFPAVVTLFLLTKGLSALNQLTTSVNDLTKMYLYFRFSKKRGAITAHCESVVYAALLK